MKKQQVSILLAIISLLVLIVPTAAAKPSEQHPSNGAVYIMTNGKGATGLAGSNQGGLALSNDGKTLLVVNAGTNDISVFQVNQDGLVFTDKTGSGGTFPISVTVHQKWVYVLNTGGTERVGNIAGFNLSDDGQLSAIPGSIQPLSGTTAPAQISFNPTGSALVVTEKSTSLID